MEEALLLWKESYKRIAEQHPKYTDHSTKPISPHNEERALMFIQGAAFQAQRELDGDEISGMKFGFHDAAGI